MKSVNAKSVSRSLQLINTLEKSHALRVVQLYPLTELKDVYNLTVEKEHCYFANSVLVSNCDAMRYVATSVLTYIDVNFLNDSMQAEFRYDPLAEFIEKHKRSKGYADELSGSSSDTVFADNSYDPLDLANY